MNERHAIFESDTLKVFLASVVLYLAVQLLLNALLPFAYFSEFSGHDGSVYYAISGNPLPDMPLLSLKRYQRPLLPALVWALFWWDRHLGFSVVNAAACALAACYFYRIARERRAAAWRTTLVFAATPYLFVGAHLGLTEPLMIAGLLAGYYYARRGEYWKAFGGYAVALLAKEIAIFPILAELVFLFRQAGPRPALRIGLSLVPAAAWYLLLGLWWGQPFWMLHGTDGQLGFGPAAMLALIADPSAAHAAPRAFSVLNQIANGLLLLLIAVGLYQLRDDGATLVWVGCSALPLLFLGQAVYANNFDLGRQALPATLLLMVVGASRFARSRVLYWSGVGGLLCCSLLWTLYFARFFLYY